MTLDQTMGNAGNLRGAASPAPLSIDSVRDRVRGYSYRPIAADDGALSAAVLVPLYQLGSELHVILTKRTMLVTMHRVTSPSPVEDARALRNLLDIAFAEV